MMMRQIVTIAFREATRAPADVWKRTSENDGDDTSEVGDVTPNGDERHGLAQSRPVGLPR